ncbi:MAG: flagellar export chaperone FlgN [Actinomycetota bacterium]|nr:flagellar export chaperone FlgN [Actinomycetota bacterium]
MSAPFASGAPGAVAVAAPLAREPLSEEVLAHLELQLASARRLLAAILAQGAAIRDRAVDRVLGCMGDIKGEMELRGRLEDSRGDLLARAGARLGVAPAGVTLEGLASLMGPAEAAGARERSAELRGLLAEIAREHGVNRALMRQELAFLDHLVRMIGEQPRAGYRPGGGAAEAPTGPEPAVHRVFDLQA